MDVVKLRSFASLPARWAAVLVAYAGIVFATIAHHEPWFDEAQSWLLARDLSLPQLVFHWIRYEGTPPLWQLILWVANRMHMPYLAMGWISGLIAVAGIFVFLKYSPFPSPLKLVLPFSYFFLYQYAVVARSYVLLPVLAFTVAALYRRADGNPFGFSMAALLLANVSVHGLILSAGITAARALDVYRDWGAFDAAARRRLLTAAAAYAAGILAVVAITWPPADASFLPKGRPGLQGVQEALGGGIINQFDLSVVVLLIVLYWCAVRRALTAFLVPMAALVAFFCLVYVNAWHHGTVTILLVTALWISWPSPEEIASKASHARARTELAVMLLLVFAVQVFWSVSTIGYDLRKPYSGAQDAAAYLKSIGAERQRIYAYRFTTVAILPYFDHQIFANQAAPGETAFWRWNRANHIDADFGRFDQGKPEYVIIGVKRRAALGNAAVDYIDDGTVWAEQALLQNGYSYVHDSEGASYWKTGTLETDSFMIFARSDLVNSGGARSRSAPEQTVR